MTTVAIAGGFRATAPYRFNDEQTYAVEITAETTTTVGTPEVLSYTFLTAFWVGSSLAMAGVTAGYLSGAVGLAGSLLVVASGLVRLSGNLLSVPATYLRLDGSVGTSVDLLRTGETVILDGWVTIYVTESLLFAVIQAGEPTSHGFDAAIDASEDAAVMAGLAAALDVYSNATHHGMDAAVEAYIVVLEEAPMAIVAGEPTSHEFGAAIDVDGYQASGVVVLDSPSAEWAADEAAEDA